MNLPRLDKYTTINFILYINIFLFIINIIYFYALIPSGILPPKSNPHLVEHITFFITIAGSLLIPVEIFYRKKNNIIQNATSANKIINIGIIIFILFNIYLFNNTDKLYSYGQLHPYLYMHPPEHIITSIILIFIYYIRHFPKLNKYITVSSFISIVIFISLNFFLSYIIFFCLCLIELNISHGLDLSFHVIISEYIAGKIITTICIINILLIPIEIFLNKKNIINSHNVIKIPDKKQKIILFISIILFLIDFYLLIDYFMPRTELD